QVARWAVSNFDCRAATPGGKAIAVRREANALANQKAVIGTPPLKGQVFTARFAGRGVEDQQLAALAKHHDSFAVGTALYSDRLRTPRHIGEPLFARPEIHELNDAWFFQVLIANVHGVRRRLD